MAKKYCNIASDKTIFFVLCDENLQPSLLYRTYSSLTFSKILCNNRDHGKRFFIRMYDLQLHEELSDQMLQQKSDGKFQLHSPVLWLTMTTLLTRGDRIEPVTLIRHHRKRGYQKEINI